MNLKSFLQTLRPSGGCDQWAELILSRQGAVISRQALENYVAGRRIPKAYHFETILLAADKSQDDPLAWSLWVQAHRARPPTVLARQRILASTPQRLAA